MMRDNAERMRRIRERAKQHDEQLESASWMTPADLAARWNVGLTSIYMIPKEQLDYKPFGTGTRPRRRYSPAAVAAFEASRERYVAPEKQEKSA